MSKDMIKSMKHSLLCCAQGQMSHLDKVDAKELGEVIDMIKDLEEAMYYSVITEAMQKQGHDEYKDKQESIYYSDPYHIYYKDWNNGRMYYPKTLDKYYPEDDWYNDSYAPRMMGEHGGSKYYHEKEVQMMRDRREGISPISRRKYMEAKEMHHDKNVQLQELEKYMKELSDDIIEMIDDASSEEKKYLANKISALATKVSKLDG